MAFIEVLDKMVYMLKKADQTNDRDAGDLIFRKLNKQNRESNRKLANNEPYVSIDRKWMFGLLGVRISQPKGAVVGGC